MNGMGGVELTLPLVVGAALVDSVNPCAFAVLLTFIAATLVLLANLGISGSVHVAAVANLVVGGVALALWKAGR